MPGMSMMGRHTHAYEQPGRPLDQVNHHSCARLTWPLRSRSPAEMLDTTLPIIYLGETCTSN